MAIVVERAERHEPPAPGGPQPRPRSPPAITSPASVRRPLEAPRESARAPSAGPASVVIGITRLRFARASGDRHGCAPARSSGARPRRSARPPARAARSSSGRAPRGSPPPAAGRAPPRAKNRPSPLLGPERGRGVPASVRPKVAVDRVDPRLVLLQQDHLTAALAEDRAAPAAVPSRSSALWTIGDERQPVLAGAAGHVLEETPPRRVLEELPGLVDDEDARGPPPRLAPAERPQT